MSTPRSWRSSPVASSKQCIVLPFFFFSFGLWCEVRAKFPAWPCCALNVSCVAPRPGWILGETRGRKGSILFSRSDNLFALNRMFLERRLRTACIRCHPSYQGWGLPTCIMAVAGFYVHVVTHVGPCSRYRGRGSEHSVWKPLPRKSFRSGSGSGASDDKHDQKQKGVSAMEKDHLGEGDRRQDRWYSVHAGKGRDALPKYGQLGRGMNHVDIQGGNLPARRCQGHDVCQ